MTKKTLILILILPFVLTACTLNPFASNDAESESTNTSENTQTSSENSMQGTLTSLLGLGKNLQCTFNYSDDTTASSGNVYVSGERFRGDFETTYNDETSISHMISDDQMVYVWTDGQEQGFVMEATDPEEIDIPEVDTLESSTNTVDLDQEYEYDCDSWIPDNKMFEVPGDVEFTSIQEQLENIEKEVMENLDLDCSTCDSLSGDAKTQCLAAIGC